MSDGCHQEVTPEAAPAEPTFVTENSNCAVTAGPGTGEGDAGSPDFPFPPEDEAALEPPALTGLREFRADFETATHSISAGGSLDHRPDAVAFDYLTAFTLGPINIGDASAGAVDRVWRACAVNGELGGDIYLSRANDANTEWEAETLLFSYTGTAREIDVAFEQLGRAVVTLEIEGHVWLYWFDPTPAAFVLEDFGVGRTPRVLLDNPADTSTSDVLFFYILDGTGIVYRTQRDAYEPAVTSPVIVTTNRFLEDVFRGTDNRLVVVYSERNTVLGQYSLKRLESTLYPYITEPDEFTAFLLLQSGGLPVVVIVAESILEEYQALLAIQAGILADAIIVHVLFDVDEYKAVLAIQAGSLPVVVIEHTVFDLDEYKAVLSIQAGSLPTIVIEHTVFDVDEYKATLSIQGGTLAP